VRILCVCMSENVLEISTEIDGKGYFPIYQARPEDCVFCAMCCEMCPDVAISISQDVDEVPVEEVGWPIKMAELLAALETPGYISRQTVIKPKYIRKAKKAIKQAFEYQLENRCFSFVELISTCPTNWGMTRWKRCSGLKKLCCRTIAGGLQDT
jgi:formate hydrogenlyase subunit 6/NADH:ubiquinone oxidoreductase subunit I